MQSHVMVQRRASSHDLPWSDQTLSPQVPVLTTITSVAVNLVLRCVGEVVPNLEYILSSTYSVQCKRREERSSILPRR